MWPAVSVVFCYYLWSLPSCHLLTEERWQLPEVWRKKNHGRIYIWENSIHWLNYFWEFRKDHHDPLATKMLGLTLEVLKFCRGSFLRNPVLCNFVAWIFCLYWKFLKNHTVLQQYKVKLTQRMKIINTKGGDKSWSPHPATLPLTCELSLISFQSSSLCGLFFKKKKM